MAAPVELRIYHAQLGASLRPHHRHEDAAAYERALERFTSLAAATTGPAADRLRQLADQASPTPPARALAAQARAPANPPA